MGKHKGSSESMTGVKIGEPEPAVSYQAIITRIIGTNLWIRICLA